MTASETVPWKPVLIGIAVTAVFAGVVALTAIRTQPVRRSVTTFTKLLGAANQQDIDAARRLCSARYLQTHSMEPAAEGGIIGLPRNAHPNFQAWRQGPNVWLCPRNRVGPVYQFVLEDGLWKFDGLVGLLRGRGEFVPQEDTAERSRAGR